MDTLTSLSPDIAYNLTTGMYEINTSIIILENDTLLISPGEILNFMGHFYIRIEGLLIAIGTKNEVIKLGNPEFIPGSGLHWCGIQIINSPLYKESTLKYCDIRGALNVCSMSLDSDVSIFCENSSPIIDHCNFSYINSGWETGGGSAIACRGQSYPIVGYCKFEYLINSIAIWCNPWDTSPDTVNYPSPLVFGCNIMSTVYSFFFDLIDYDVVIYRGGFLDNCYLGAYNSNYVDNTLGIPIDTIGDGICNTTSTYWMKRFMDVDGVVHPRSDTLITGINETEVEILPTTSEQQILKNCFPNPFNEFTTISFEIPESFKNVSLSIIDSKGNTVRDLINDKIYNQGRYHINWNGDYNSGTTAPRGIYFYKLTYNGKVEMKKAIVIK
jgi:hypothetical protein